MPQSEVINIFKHNSLLSIKIEELCEEIIDDVTPMFKNSKKIKGRRLLHQFTDNIVQINKQISAQILEEIDEKFNKEIREQKQLQKILDQYDEVKFTKNQTKYILKLFQKVPYLDRQKFVLQCIKVMKNSSKTNLTRKLNHLVNKKLKRVNFKLE